MKKSHQLAHQPASHDASPARSASDPQAYAFGPFRLLPSERSLRRGDRHLPLPPKAFDALLLLVRNAGHLLRKQELMDALWPNTFVEEVNLANKISVLRKVLDGATYIQTVSKLGYRFLPAVTEIWSAAPPTIPPAPKPPGDGPVRLIALPFLLGGDPGDLAFLAASLPEAVAASLASLRAFTVRSSLLATRLGDRPWDPRAIAAEADVDVILTGRILSGSGRLRVTAEVVEAATSTVIGAVLCDAASDSIFELQDSLVRRIVELLLPALGRRDLQPLDRDVPASARAYEFYLRAAHIERQRTYENLCIARDLYRQSVDEDPDYAPAWARLGRCYRFLEKFDPERVAATELTQWAFRRAFSLNPDLPIAHNHYTQIEADSGHAQRAMVRLLGQARKYPHDPDLFTGLVEATRYCGLLDESVQAHHRARKLDPRAVTSIAHTYFLLGDYERTLEFYPPGRRFYLDAAALALLGREDEAVALLPERRSLAPLVESLHACLVGDAPRAVEIVTRALDSAVPPEPEIRFYLARHLAHAGAPALALDLLRKLVDDGFFSSIALGRDPWLEPLASAPDFPALLDAVSRREQDARAAFEAAGGPRALEAHFTF